MHPLNCRFGNNPYEGEDVEEKETGRKTAAFISTTSERSEP